MNINQANRPSAALLRRSYCKLVQLGPGFVTVGQNYSATGPSSYVISDTIGPNIASGTSYNQRLGRVLTFLNISYDHAVISNNGGMLRILTVFNPQGFTFNNVCATLVDGRLVANYVETSPDSFLDVSIGTSPFLAPPTYRAGWVVLRDVIVGEDQVVSTMTGSSISTATTYTTLTSLDESINVKRTYDIFGFPENGVVATYFVTQGNVGSTGLDVTSEVFFTQYNYFMDGSFEDPENTQS